MLYLHAKFGGDPTKKFGVFCLSVCMCLSRFHVNLNFGLKCARSVVRDKILSPSIGWLWRSFQRLFQPYANCGTNLLTVATNIAKLHQNFEIFVKFGGRFCALDFDHVLSRYQQNALSPLFSQTLQLNGHCQNGHAVISRACLLYTSPSPRD